MSKNIFSKINERFLMKYEKFTGKLRGKVTQKQQNRAEIVFVREKCL